MRNSSVMSPTRQYRSCGLKRREQRAAAAGPRGSQRRARGGRRSGGRQQQQASLRTPGRRTSPPSRIQYTTMPSWHLDSARLGYRGPQPRCLDGRREDAEIGTPSGRREGRRRSRCGGGCSLPRSSSRARVRPVFRRVRAARVDGDLAACRQTYGIWSATPARRGPRRAHRYSRLAVLRRRVPHVEDGSSPDGSRLHVCTADPHLLLRPPPGHDVASG